jgi:hypothetical protein
MGILKYKAFRGLLFAGFGLFLSSAHADDEFTSILPQLQFADTRLEMAMDPPAKYRRKELKALRQLSLAFRKEEGICRNSRVCVEGLIHTKAYLQGLLLKIASSSKIPAGRVNTSYGVCIEPIPDDDGMFSFLSGPRLKRGIIELQKQFLVGIESEDELAFIVAHEFSHFLLKHEILFTYMESTGHNEDYFEAESEREADELGMRLLLNAGYNLDVALEPLKAQRLGDVTHFDGTQLQAARDIVLEDMANAKRKVTWPAATEIPPEVAAEMSSVKSASATP